MEKTLRYLLVSFAVMMVMSVSAQSLAQQPTTEFHSTSSMVGSGSTLPMAVQDGAHTTYDVNSEASRSNKPGIRKWGEGEGEPGDWHEPYEDPIGDAAWPLLLAVAVYGVWCMVYRRKHA